MCVCVCVCAGGGRDILGHTPTHLSVVRVVPREVVGVRRAISESGKAREERRERRDVC